MWVPAFGFAFSTVDNFSTDIFVNFIGFFFSTTTSAGTSNAASKVPGLRPDDLRIDAFFSFNGFFFPAIAPAPSGASSASVGAEFVEAHIVRGLRAPISQGLLKLDPGIPYM